MENFKLKDFYLNEDYTKDVNIDDPSKLYDPVNENNDILKYNTTIDGRKYKVSFDVNKNPTKRGIKVKFFPLDEAGNEIENPSPEQLAQLQNDVATRLAPKFNEFKLEFDEDQDAPEKNVAAFQIPLSSFVSFIANVVFKK
tara:strand:- start:2816 stop:3238 length:423 start_codon:yes stop_codon:yes gene_type:complete